MASRWCTLQICNKMSYLHNDWLQSRPFEATGLALLVRALYRDPCQKYLLPAKCRDRIDSSSPKSRYVTGRQRNQYQQAGSRYQC